MGANNDNINAIINNSATPASDLREGSRAALDRAAEICGWDPTPSVRALVDLTEGLCEEERNQALQWIAISYAYREAAESAMLQD